VASHSGCPGSIFWFFPRTTRVARFAIACASFLASQSTSPAVSARNLSSHVDATPPAELSAPTQTLKGSQDSPKETKEKNNQAPAKPGAADEIVVTAVGDVMLGSTYPDETGGELPPNDGADLLSEVAPFLKLGDVTFGNLEGPLIDDGATEKCEDRVVNCFAFRVPTRYGKYLKAAGFTVLGLANNHALDFGQDGRESSRRTLDSLKLAHSGEIGDIAHLKVKGERVALLAFATYPGAYNLLDLDDAVQAVKDAREHADIVIVSFHGGGEGATHQHVPEGEEIFLGENRGDLRRFTHAMVDAGAGLVIGHGPHVIRGMEIYQGRLIAYSLGNFATYGRFNLKAEDGLSLILEAHLGMDGAFRGGRVYPIKQEKPGGPKLDPEMSILPILRELSWADFIGTGVECDDKGFLAPEPAKRYECLDVPDPEQSAAVSESCGWVIP
jgi:hypothetical protein